MRLIVVDDPNLNDYDSSTQAPNTTTRQQSDVPAPAARSRSFSRDRSQEGAKSYATTLNDIRRLRSKHLERTMSTQPHRPRRSRVLDGPNAEAATDGAEDAIGQRIARKDVKIEEELHEETENGNLPETFLQDSTTGIKDRSITFEDLNRLVAVEQSKQKRPMSFLRKSRTRSPTKRTGASNLTDLTNSSNGDVNRSEARDMMTSNDSSMSLQMRTKTYFSELSALELFIVRHIAVMSLEPLVKDYFNMEELLDLIETRKAGFWGKFGKAFKPPKEKAQKEKDEKKSTKKRGVFGVGLETLVERNSADSTLGAGPQTLRIPGFIDDVIVAMRDMDMSVEGVFRKNGNIRKLKQLADDIDKSPSAMSLSDENAVQLAALLKKFLRDLPDPLMTFKLHKLFVCAQSTLVLHAMTIVSD